MGRRRKKYKRVIRRVRRIPSVFHCPHCGSRSLTIEFKKGGESVEPGMKIAVVRCGNCGLYAEMVVPELFEPVDVYNKFVDAYNEGTIELQFTKREESEEELGEIGY